MEQYDFLVRYPPAEFLANFLPLPPGYRPERPDPAIQMIAHSMAREAFSCEKMVQLLKDYDLCPNLEFQDYEGVFPQLAGYSPSRIPLGPGLHECYNEAELIIESTLANCWTPDVSTAPAAFEFMHELFTHQHRTHFFSVHIHNNNFRFVRWDRAAAVATEIADALWSAPLLLEFFKRFSLLDPQARGHDTSAVRATEDEQRMLLESREEITREHGYLRGSAQTVLATFLPYKLRVDSGDGSGPQYYIVQGPCTRSDGLIGPGMRGYWAWCLSRRELVFLKDAWGVATRKMLLPRELHVLGVFDSSPFLPRTLGMGHVLDDDGFPQTTVAFYLDHWPWERGGDNQLEHHRVAHEFLVELDLKALCEPRQVVLAIRDTLLVIEHVYSQGGILHTNISPENIMYNPKTQRGHLVNWDYAVRNDCTLDYKPKKSPYQSIWSHLTTQRVYQIQDDVESCFWALFEIALACGQPSWGPARQWWRKTSVDVFNPICPVTTKLEKLMSLETGTLKFSSPAFTATIHGFAAKVRKIYDVPGVDVQSLSYAEKCRVLTEYYWSVRAEKDLTEIRSLVAMLDELLRRPDWEPPRRLRFY